MRRSPAFEILFALFLGLLLTGVLYALLITVNPAPTSRADGAADWPLFAATFLVIAATLVMVGALLMPYGLRVMGNGGLFGGLFTMLIGITYTLWSDRAVPRLMVMVAALFVTVVVGYVRFTVRARSGEEKETGQACAGELESRVADLERRLDRASDALR